MPWAISFRLVATAGFTLVVLGTTAPILALNKPALATSTYEILEPETWVGKELPILEYIDIADQLKTGTWLVLFYHYDCPHCQETIREYEQMARDLAGNGDVIRIAFIEVPPYGPRTPRLNSSGALGRLDKSKEWFITTPAIVLVAGGRVRSDWEIEVPNLVTILAQILGRKGEE